MLVAGTIAPARADDAQASQPAKDGSLTQLSLAQLGDIQVTTVSKEPEEIWKTPAAIYVLTQEDIRRSGATSIPEALRLAPGVEVARIDSDKWAIGIRGFEGRFSRGLLVLIDGRTVYTPLFHGVYWEVQDTLLEDVERIEVIRGPGGTIWGANAVNGVINIITKNAKQTRGALVTAGGGNLDRGTGGVRYGGGTDNGFDYRVYGKGFDRGPEFHADGSNYDAQRMSQAGFRSDYTRDRDSLTFSGDIYSSSAGERVAVATYTAPYSTNIAQNAELAGGNVSGRWQRVLNAGSDLQLQAYYDRTNRGEVNFGESQNTFDVDFLHHMKLPLHQDFLWGAGVRVSAGTVAEVSPTLVFTPAQQTDKLYSVFVQDQIPLGTDRVSLILGSKLLDNIYTGFEAQPSARLLWTPGSKQSVWAAFSRAVRTPSRIDEDRIQTTLISVAPLTYRRLIGDGGFDSEDMLGYEAGYRKLFTPKLYLDVATFYNNYEHLMSAEPGTPFTESAGPGMPTYTVDPFYVRNGQVGTGYGLELTPKWNPTPRWTLSGSYSYEHLHVRSGGSSLDVSTPASNNGSSPHHEVVVQSLLNLPKRFETDLTYRFVSALPAQSVAAYSTGDIRVGWHSPRHFELSLIGQNLFAPSHVEFGGDPGGLVGIERSVYAKVTWSYATF